MQILRNFISNILDRHPGLFYRAKYWDLFLHKKLKILYERDFKLLQSLIHKSDPTIIDVGANIGQSIIDFSILFPSSKIISFEANKNLKDYLEFVSKHAECSVEIILKGLSRVESTKTLYIPIRNSVYIFGEASFDKTEFFRNGLENRIGKYNIDSINVSTLIFDNLKIKPDIIKIDVQGHEFSVLQGMTETINFGKPVFIIERSCNDLEIIHFLSRYSYQFYIPLSGSLVSYSKGLMTTNMFCVPK